MPLWLLPTISFLGVVIAAVAELFAQPIRTAALVLGILVAAIGGWLTYDGLTDQAANAVEQAAILKEANSRLSELSEDFDAQAAELSSANQSLAAARQELAALRSDYSSDVLLNRCIDLFEPVQPLWSAYQAMKIGREIVTPQVKIEQEFELDAYARYREHLLDEDALLRGMGIRHPDNWLANLQQLAPDGWEAWPFDRFVDNAEQVLAEVEASGCEIYWPEGHAGLLAVRLKE
jgi:hypothetical protein